MNARLYARTNRTARLAGRPKTRPAGLPAARGDDLLPNRPAYSRGRRRESAFDVWSLCETL